MMATLIYIDAKGERSVYDTAAEAAKVRLPERRALLLPPLNRAEGLIWLHAVLEQRKVPVLFDPKMAVIASRVEKLRIGEEDGVLPADAFALFFTSGTTGVPTGVCKTRENIESEVDALAAVFGPMGFERVILTVPFLHIYGFLNGAMLPERLGCETLLKEEFWPQELLTLHEGKKTLVVTTPVFIKSLLRLRRDEPLEHLVFLSSTGLLLESEVEAFEAKYTTTLFQLLGSTETGGVALKRGSTPRWEPLPGVQVTQDEEGGMIVDSPFVGTYRLEERFEILPRPFAMSDIIELLPDGFRLAGRRNELLKIAGKRIAVTELEHLLETGLPVREVLIRIVRDSSRLKDERLSIEVVADVKPDPAEITALLARHYPGIHFAFDIVCVDAVEKNAMGKKVRK